MKRQKPSGREWLEAQARGGLPGFRSPLTHTFVSHAAPAPVCLIAQPASTEAATRRLQFSHRVAAEPLSQRSSPSRPAEAAMAGEIDCI